MSKCAFLSMDSLEGYICDDELVKEPLSALGWKVETVSWRNYEVDWNEFDAVIVRTTWDYSKNSKEFLSALQNINSSRAVLQNPLSLIEWNIDKSYLRELQQQGVKIIPTIWGEKPINEETLSSWYKILRTDEIVIKPMIGANAEDTFRLSNGSLPPESLFEAFVDRGYMVQPFVRTVVSDGEFSLFYFGGKYSHAIVKAPKSGDFRVQEEHGGIIQSVKPPKQLLETARSIISRIKPTPLYARADFLLYEQKFALLELELIEPSLYFRTDAKAPFRFAQTLDALTKS